MNLRTSHIILILDKGPGPLRGNDENACNLTVALPREGVVVTMNRRSRWSSAHDFTWRKEFHHSRKALWKPAQAQASWVRESSLNRVRLSVEPWRFESPAVYRVSCASHFARLFNTVGNRGTFMRNGIALRNAADTLPETTKRRVVPPGE